jgi:hypothetical protein
MGVAFAASGAAPFAVAVPRPLFRFDASAFRDYDVTPDGQRFLFNLGSPDAETRSDEVIVEWTRLVRR